MQWQCPNDSKCQILQQCYGSELNPTRVEFGFQYYTEVKTTLVRISLELDHILHFNGVNKSTHLLKPQPTLKIDI